MKKARRIYFKKIGGRFPFFIIFYARPSQALKAKQKLNFNAKYPLRNYYLMPDPFFHLKKNFFFRKVYNKLKKKNFKNSDIATTRFLQERIDELKKERDAKEKLKGLVSIAPFVTKKRSYSTGKNFVYDESFVIKNFEFIFPLGLSFLSVNPGFLVNLLLFKISKLRLYNNILFDPFNYYIIYLLLLFNRPFYSFLFTSNDTRCFIYLFFLKIYKCVLPSINFFFKTPYRFVPRYSEVS